MTRFFLFVAVILLGLNSHAHEFEDADLEAQWKKSLSSLPGLPDAVFLVEEADEVIGVGGEGFESLIKDYQSHSGKAVVVLIPEAFDPSLNPKGWKKARVPTLTDFFGEGIEKKLSDENVSVTIRVVDFLPKKYAKDHRSKEKVR